MTRSNASARATAILVSIIVGSLAAFLAGAAAVKAQENAGLAAISSGLQKGLDLPGQEGKARSCMARLLSLELTASAKRQSPEHIDEEYRRVVGEYPELFE